MLFSPEIASFSCLGLAGNIIGLPLKHLSDVRRQCRPAVRASKSARTQRVLVNIQGKTLHLAKARVPLFGLLGAYSWVQAAS